MANSIKIGGFSFDALKIGGSDVDAAYIGDTLVYSGGTTPPSFQGKWLTTYTGGTTSSAECDASSAITQNEITLTDLVSVEIGDCVTSIGQSAFAYCGSLTSIDIPSSVTTIDPYAFRGCSGLISIVIPNGVTRIRPSLFENCSNLTSVTIPSGVTSIGSDAFYQCRNLKSVIIPSNVTNIYYRAFYQCVNLTSITVESITPPTINQDYGGIFNGSTCPIYVPCDSVEAYKTASGWSDYASRITCVQPKTLQWVSYSEGDTIPSDLQIYGIKGIVDDLSRVFYMVDDGIYVELDKGKYNVYIGDYASPCYREYGVVSNTSVEYTFSNIGCSDSYTVSSKTIANMSNDIQLLIYA